MAEEDTTETPVGTIGINVRRHKELIHSLFELVEASGTGQFISTSQLIDLIPDEPTFTKKDAFILDCIWLPCITTNREIQMAKSHDQRPTGLRQRT